MTEPVFFDRGAGLTVGEIAAQMGATARTGVRLEHRITGVATLGRATPADLVFLDRQQYAAELATSDAGACLTTTQLATHAPPQMSVLCVAQPYRAFVDVTRKLFPAAARPSSLFEARGTAVGAFVHPNARLENGVIIDPGAVVGPGAEIGAGTLVSAGAVIGPRVRIGRECVIGANASITHSLIGDRVIIHPGCAIGQDGFGYLPSARGHGKILQIGRVIIQDDVEIGAGTTIDRGALGDTVIGEGTKIDNLVQVGHNTSIGRHCIVVAQSGISGSVTVEDFAVLAARVGVSDHRRIGEGAVLAARTSVVRDIPPGGRWAGIPAKPIKQWLRELLMVERLAARGGDGDEREGDR
jgi:UDP-3-O-[3-hydroxymyristoyl] glucosamine N-acyltransferase